MPHPSCPLFCLPPYTPPARVPACLQRVPATETSGRVHTSTATVAIMPEVDDVDVKIDPKVLSFGW